MIPDDENRKLPASFPILGHLISDKLIEFVSDALLSYHQLRKVNNRQNEGPSWLVIESLHHRYKVESNSLPQTDFFDSLLIGRRPLPNQSLEYLRNTKTI